MKVVILFDNYIVYQTELCFIYHYLITKIIPTQKNINSIIFLICTYNILNYTTRALL